MLKVTRKNCSFLQALRRNFSGTENVLVTQNLEDRTLLRLKGNDSSLYLQGLITNDMSHLQGGTTCIYAMFLNNKGRVLYDTMVYKSISEDTYFVECDKLAASALKDHLLHFKVRRKTNIDLVGEELTIWSLARSTYQNAIEDTSPYKNLCNQLKEKMSQLIVATDPRVPNMGLRIIAPKNLNICNEIENLTGLKLKEDRFYKQLRYKLGIAEGTQELPPEKCFPMEVNGDFMHGISFHKGCYIGQELTARTHHTGVIRKRVMPISFNDKIDVHEHGMPIYSAEQTNKSIGKLYGVEHKSGVGLLRIEEALKADELIVSNNKCKTHHPFWWPIEAPKNRIKAG